MQVNILSEVCSWKWRFFPFSSSEVVVYSACYVVININMSQSSMLSDFIQNTKIVFSAALLVRAKSSPHGGRGKSLVIWHSGFHAPAKPPLIILFFFQKPLPSVYPPGKAVAPWEEPCESRENSKSKPVKCFFFFFYLKMSCKVTSELSCL